MKIKVQKIKIVPLLLCLMVISAMFILRAQKEVYSDSTPILVNMEEMEFGDVYPGQEASKNFTVSYAGHGSGVYTIGKIHKPKHGATAPAGFKGSVSDYCQTQDGIVDQTRCYRYLCPFIDVSSAEKEGDTTDNASVSPTDNKDVWTVHLKTPAIFGKVTQDYKGDLVSESGEYGCDLSFNAGIPETPVCGNSKVEEGEKCDDGNIRRGDGCSSTCQIELGTISGCKFNDLNDNGKIDTEEEDKTMGGFEIQLVKCPYAPLPIGVSTFNKKSTINTNPIPGMTGYCSVSATTKTGEDGCYSFDDLSAGDYGLNETGKSGWKQTFPASDSYHYLKLTAGADAKRINFLNHKEESAKPVCGNGTKEEGEECDDGNHKNGDGCSCSCKTEVPPTPEKASISGCKYNDKNGNGTVDDGEEKMSGFDIQLVRCPYAPMAAGNSTTLKKLTINTNPVAGSVGYCSVVKTTTTGEDGCYSFGGLDGGDYGVNEINKSDWNQTKPVSDSYYYVNVSKSQKLKDINFLNQRIVIPPAGPVCGNGKVESGESCDDGNTQSGDGCSATCNTESHGGGGGGGGVIIPLRITEEKVTDINCTNIKFTWLTNKKTNSRVVCSDKSISKTNLGSKPDYGYDFSTSTYDILPNVLSHSITMFDLKPETNYYCRVISSVGSTEVVSSELSFKTPSCGTITPPPEMTSLYIYNLTLQSLSKTCATFKWNTNINGTTCTIYSGASKALGEKPKYGYDWNTPNCWNLAKQNTVHTETICGLNPCTTYYFRLTSTNGKLDAVTEQQQVRTLCQAKSTYYPRTYYPAIATSKPVVETGKVQSAKTSECPTCPTCPTCAVTTCEVCQKCQDVVKTVIEKQRYMSYEDWFILLLILIVLTLLINALRNRNRKGNGTGSGIIGGGMSNSGIKRSTETIQEDKINLD